jgi:hypothetical protein
LISSITGIRATKVQEEQSPMSEDMRGILALRKRGRGRRGIYSTKNAREALGGVDVTK